MRKALLIVAVLRMASMAYANSKLTALTQDTTAQSTDLIYKVDNPNGSALSRSAAVGNILIMNQQTLQSGATFYVSSGTIAQRLIIRSAPSTGFGSTSSYLNFSLRNNTVSSAPDLTFHQEDGDSFNLKVEDSGAADSSLFTLNPNQLSFTANGEVNPGFDRSLGFTMVNSTGSTTTTAAGSLSSLAVYETKSMPISRDILKVAIDNEDFSETPLFEITKTTITAREPLSVVGATVSINGIQYNWPNTDGTGGQFLTTNGNRHLSFTTAATAGTPSISYALLEKGNSQSIGGGGTQAQLLYQLSLSSSGLTTDTTNSRLIINPSQSGSYIFCGDTHYTVNISNTNEKFTIRKNGNDWRQWDLGNSQTSLDSTSYNCVIDTSSVSADYYELWMTNNAAGTATVYGDALSQSPPHFFSSKFYGWRLQ